MHANNVFDTLKAILKKYEPKLQLVHNNSENYYLHTPVNDLHAKGEFFAAVQVKKNYVAFHLMPLYYYPGLLNDVSVELKKHMQGKSCFNFTEHDNLLLAELKKLSEAAFEKYIELGKIT